MGIICEFKIKLSLTAPPPKKTPKSCPCPPAGEVSGVPFAASSDPDDPPSSPPSSSSTAVSGRVFQRLPPWDQGVTGGRVLHGVRVFRGRGAKYGGRGGWTWTDLFLTFNLSVFCDSNLATWRHSNLEIKLQLWLMFLLFSLTKFYWKSLIRFSDFRWVLYFLREKFHQPCCGLGL